MPRSLADGKTKLTFLTTEPANSQAPTAAELNAGIDASCNVLASDFTWGPTDSDKVQEKALCTKNNANAFGPSNYQAGVTPFREFDSTNPGKPDATADTVFAAMKVKGTELWGYARRTGKDANDAWATGDEIFFGAHVLTDSPQPPQDLGGYIKFRVPMEPQEGYEFIVVGGVAWQATHAYALNDVVTISSSTLKCTTAGTSGASAPTPPGSVGGTVTDGTVVWTRTA